MTETPEWQGRPETTPVGGPPQSPYPYSYPPGPQGQYGGYPPPPMPYGDYPGTPPILRNGMGVAALVIAIIGLLASPSVAGGIVLGIAAVILGFLGRNRVRRGEADNGGIALAGILLGALAIIAGLLFVVFVWVPVFRDVGASDYVDCLQNAGQDPQAAQLCADDLRDSLQSRLSQTNAPRR